MPRRIPKALSTLKVRRARFRNYPEFADAFKFAASAFDERVERALVERAIGYEVDSEEIRVVDGKVLHIPVRRQFPPDVGAATLYLTNRMPHKYKSMVEVQNTGAKIEDTEMIVEEIQTKILRLAAKYQVALPGFKPKKKQNSGGAEGDGGAGTSGVWPYAGKPDPLEKAAEQTAEQREPLRQGQAVLASRRRAILRLLRPPG